MSDIQIIQGDCLEVMGKMDDNFVDTIITDPPYGLSFMGKKWDYDVPQVDTFQEMLRVLKPGGTLLCFAGSRTQHRMACNVEDAGFILKDTIMWLYGSGFPKATDISKQLDKGVEREVVARVKGMGKQNPEWNGTGNGRSEDYYKPEYNLTAPATPAAKLWNGWKSHGLKPAYEPILVAMKPNDGSYANNALEWGVSGLWIDGARISTQEQLQGGSRQIGDGNKYGTISKTDDGFVQNPSGRFPANIILDEEAGRMLDEQSGIVHGGRNLTQATSIFGSDTKHRTQVKRECDKGGASRFFYKVDNDCFMCYNAYTKTINTESELWKRLYVNSVEENLKITTETDLFIARLSAMQRASERFVQNVKSAGNLCDKCAISIAHALVGIKNLDFKTGELQAILGYIGSCKSSILIQNLVNYAELWASTATTPTTNNLSVLFGSVHHAIRNYTPETGKSEPRRFKYTPKASKAERNAGCEGLEERERGQKYGLDSGGNTPQQTPHRHEPQHNYHPTVKPLALMEHLCKLTMTPTKGIVLDPFTGSGTTGVACKNTGRDFIGIELDPEYFEIAKNRINNVEVDLFAGLK